MTTTSKTALQVDTKKQKDDLAGYTNAKAQVAAYVTSLQNTDISGVTFKNLPAGLQDKLPESPKKLLAKVQAELATAKTHGQFWSNEIQPDLTKIPQAIINFNTQFDAEYAVIVPLVNDLIAKPNPAKRQELVELFQGLIQKIDEQSDAISGEVTKLKTFNAEITEDHGNFSSGNKEFDAIKKFEEANIKALNEAIKGLESTIKALDKAITAEAIAAGVSAALIAGGALGLASAETGVGLVIGAVVMVIGMIGVGVALGELISSIEKKQSAEQKKAFDNLEVTELTVQVQALNTTEKALSNLVDQSAKAMSAVQVILDTWATLKVKIQAVVTDLGDAEKKIGDIMSLVDLETAKTQWGQLEDFANSMQDLESKLYAKPPQKLELPPMKVHKKAA